MERCWAESYCKGYPNKCNEYCIGYVQLKNIYALSNIPKKYQYEIPLKNPGGEDVNKFLWLREFQLNAEENIKEGNGVFLYSDTKGNGKTSWVCKIVNSYFKSVALKNNLRCRGYFVNVPEFLQLLRNDMNNPSDYTQEVLKNIKNADVVIWDDIGTESPTNWVREQLYIYINYRESNGKSQLFTSNLPLEILEQEKYLGERIVSRIVGQCTVLNFTSEDRRKIK